MKVNSIVKYSDFESKFKVNYIHKSLYNRLENYIEVFCNVKVKSWNYFEEGLFAELNDFRIIGIVPMYSDSIYSCISQLCLIKDFTFEKNHLIRDTILKRNNFKVQIGNKEYFIEFKNEDTRFKKPLNISIIRHCTYTTLLGKIKEDTELLERKKYYHIRRRIYNSIVCINRLRDGLIKKYQVFNELELKVLEKYLNDKNILFRIIEECSSYTRKYNASEDSYKFCFSGIYCNYPENNKVRNNVKLYIEVYKGYVNLYEIKDRHQQKDKYKYGIYLY